MVLGEDGTRMIGNQRSDWEDDLTIVITTMGHRRHFLKRILTYYSGLSCEKIVVDTAEDKPGFVDDAVTYLNLPALDFHDRLFHAFGSVETPFVVQCPDDDFTLISSLRRAVRFLQSRDGDNFIAVGGYLIWFGERGGLRASTVKSRWITRKTHNQVNGEFRSNDPIERLRYYTNPEHDLTPAHWVFKTRYKQGAFEMFHENPRVKPISYIDRLMLAHAAISGNIKMIPRLWQLRSDGTKVKDSEDKEDGLDYETEFETYLDLLEAGDAPPAGMLADLTELTTREASEVLFEVFREHLRGHGEVRRRVRGSSTPALWNGVSGILEYLYALTIGEFDNRYWRSMDPYRSLGINFHDQREEVQQVLSLVN